MIAKLSLGLLALIITYSTTASAQYLDSPQAGYLPAASRGPAVDSPLFQEPGPIVTFGGALDLGLSTFGTTLVDREFFSLYDAHELNGASTMDVGFEAWLEFYGHLRLGVDTSWGNGGDGVGTASLTGGGLLVEGGGRLGNSLWSLWGGAVVGKGRLTLRTEDEPGSWYEYQGRYNRVEVQGHAEVMIAPYISLRGSVGVARGWLTEDAIEVGLVEGTELSSPLPANTQMDLTPVTVMFGIVFGR